MERKYAQLYELAEKFGYVNLTPEIDLKKIKVYHRSINRPAFQLTGFYEYFDNERIQIVGRAEHEYVSRMDRELMRERFKKLFSYRFPAVIMARGIVPDPMIIDIANETGVPILSTEKTTAVVIVELINWMDEKLAETETIYGVLANVYGEGILITGPSGIGKSETAVELIKRGHRLVADDIVNVSKVSEAVIMGSAPELTRHFVEIRGLGVVDIKALYGAESVMEFSRIDMIINLEEWDDSGSYDRLGLNEEYQQILGIDVVKHTVPIRPGRNMAIVIETAAINNRQKKMGYNAARELVDRVEQEVRKNKQRAQDEEQQ